jgi:type III secretion protein J
MSPSLMLLRLLWYPLFAMLLALAGCKQLLYSQLGEQEANEILSVLALEGIAVEKTINEKHWAIVVASQDMPMAMQILSREGLPKNRYATLGDLFKREGIISTPTEERVRFIHGVSQELSRTLTMIDGVLAARVHIVLPQNDPLADRAKPSSASVFIRHRATDDMQASLTAIKSLVVRSVEGLTHDTVYVSLFAAQQRVDTALVTPKEAFLGIAVSRSQADWLRWCVLGIGLLLMTIAVGLMMTRRLGTVRVPVLEPSTPS